VALKFLLQNHPGRSQICSIGYLRRTKEKLPEKLNEDPKATTLWAKQTRGFFSGRCGEHVPCSGPFSATCSTALGTCQTNNALLFDEATVQLFHDCVVIWIPITVDVLELERKPERAIYHRVIRHCFTTRCVLLGTPNLLRWTQVVNIAALILHGSMLCHVCLQKIPHHGEGPSSVRKSCATASSSSQLCHHLSQSFCDFVWAYNCWRKG